MALVGSGGGLVGHGIQLAVVQLRQQLRVDVDEFRNSRQGGGGPGARQAERTERGRGRKMQPARGETLGRPVLMTVRPELILSLVADIETVLEGRHLQLIEGAIQGLVLTGAGIPGKCHELGIRRQIFHFPETTRYKLAVISHRGYQSIRHQTSTLTR